FIIFQHVAVARLHAQCRYKDDKSHSNLKPEEIMTPQEYYDRVLTRLKNSYQFYDYLIAAGNELCEEGYDPAFPVLAAGVDQLET
ncbi:MAG: hypothetical protein PVH85_19605, partial [Desulfobacterales bacterium]